jgi:flagellar motor protein MotB
MGACSMGCGGAARERPAASAPPTDGSAEAKELPALVEARRLRPEWFAQASSLEGRARASREQGHRDVLLAHAEAMRERAVVAVRTERAKERLRIAEAIRAREESEWRALTHERMRLEKDAAELERRTDIDRRLSTDRSTTPATVGGTSKTASKRPPSAAEVSARDAVARASHGEARQLCGAARVLLRASGTETPSAALRDAEGALGRSTAEAARRSSATASAPPLEDAFKARLACLDALVRVRRSVQVRALAGGVDSVDALFGALSARGVYEPRRDERGISVDIAPTQQALLEELVVVARAHPTFAIQVVAHGAPASPHLKELETRATETRDAFVRGGVPANRVDALAVGACCPRFDESDPRARNGNERLEIVFVHP